MPEPEKTPEPEKILVSEPVTAEILSCSPKTVYNMRKAGELPFVMIRSRPMYRVETLKEVMAARERTV